MRAMILAAGEGRRMGELTTETPKPLLKIAGHYLIDYAIANIKHAGINDIVINVSYHAAQIKTALGDGRRYGVNIAYSEEKERLEVGGGIHHALPLLGNEPFLVVSSDILTDYPLKQLFQFSDKALAHIILVKNPAYHPEGDFGLKNGKVDQHAYPAFTFANLGIYRAELFAGCKPGHFRWRQAVNPAILAGFITGELYEGTWYNIGTPADLAEANLRTQVSTIAL